MQKRAFGKTDMQTAVIGFGAWAIGGPAFAGTMPIGWGDVDDETSEAALLRSYELGINFFDTADLYGLGHSEALVGKVFGHRKEVLIATKVGQRVGNDGAVFLDYSKNYVLKACEESLKRLKRETIDFYQLHAARMPHLLNGECLEAMEILQSQGKIRYWGLSVNTYEPNEEAIWMMDRGLGHGFQVVLNILNQRAISMIRTAGQKGYGIIVRMPLQFGLLTGKFSRATTFGKDDHRNFRLPPEVLAAAFDILDPVWKRLQHYRVSKTTLAMSFILSHPEVSVVIPGIKTPQQAERNTGELVRFSQADMDYLHGLYPDTLDPFMRLMRSNG